ncbi:unnamed protein product [Microthlaspi erraticum]|uniref:F-box domain-containing protein n=1 Tax=Microthlaspi erraticum TaxID=1685480 RepID=A0A6D2JK57_9BRAS|nr:unnamed protein product [Microthlaspi erraticum]
METKQVDDKEVVRVITTVQNNSSELLPLDLTIEILKRLPPKKILALRCVSKQWCSIINSRPFTNTFMSMSMSRPRLLFAFNIAHDGDKTSVVFYSSPHPPQVSKDSPSSSLMVAKKEMVLTKGIYLYSFNRITNVHGLVSYGSTLHEFFICNPTTGQVVKFPKDQTFTPEEELHSHMYLAYDTTDGLYKVLLAPWDDSTRQHQVLTLGERKWRCVEGSCNTTSCQPNLIKQRGICINGVLYYGASTEEWEVSMIVSFDVRSEQLSYIQAPITIHLDSYNKDSLQNYLGKLAVFSFTKEGLHIWVLENVKKHEWSFKTYVSHLFGKITTKPVTMRFVGTTNDGEIVIAPIMLSKDEAFVVIFYNLEKETKTSVGFVGFEGFEGLASYDRLTIRRILISPQHVENLISF